MSPNKIIKEEKDEQDALEELTKEELAQITPPNKKLLKLAEKYPVPQEWYEENFNDYFTDNPHITKLFFPIVNVSQTTQVD